jgi:hypothetical protein
MRYFTRHELEVLQGDDCKTDYKKEIGEISGYLERAFIDNITWYYHEEHMRKYSLKHPETVFALKGQGGLSGDTWIEYYKNGKMHRETAKIVIGEYDESKLDEEGK